MKNLEAVEKTKDEKRVLQNLQKKIKECNIPEVLGPLCDPNLSEKEFQALLKKTDLKPLYDLKKEI